MEGQWSRKLQLSLCLFLKCRRGANGHSKLRESDISRCLINFVSILLLSVSLKYNHKKVEPDKSVVKSTEGELCKRKGSLQVFKMTEQIAALKHKFQMRVITKNLQLTEFFEIATRTTIT